MSAPDLHAIQKRLGGTVYDGGRRWVGPGPGHSRRDQSLSLLLTPEGRVVFHSFSGDPADAIRAHIGLEGARPSDRVVNRAALEKARRERQRAAEAERRRKAEFCASVWRATLDPERTPVAAYLESRGLRGRIPEAIRFHPAAPRDYERKFTGPAMVALVTGPNGYSAGLHCTALTPEGAKAFGSESRRVFGDVAGAAIRLAQVAPRLGIAEGVETALAFASLTGTPCWSAISSSGLAQFRAPPDTRTLVIAADNDRPGLKAAHELIERALQACDVELCASPAPGSDWADVLEGRANG